MYEYFVWTINISGTFFLIYVHFVNIFWKPFVKNWIFQSFKRNIHFWTEIYLYLNIFSSNSLFSAKSQKWYYLKYAILKICAFGIDQRQIGESTFENCYLLVEFQKIFNYCFHHKHFFSYFFLTVKILQIIS